MDPRARGSADLHRHITAAQIQAHFDHLPAMIIAPTLGVLFTAWVLKDAVAPFPLLMLVCGVGAVSLFRVALRFWYVNARDVRGHLHVWRNLAIVPALFSGITWGSIALVLYPPLDPAYRTFMLVLMALVPVAPMAALVVYMPAFYAYYLPSILPFVVHMAIQDGLPEQMTAVLAAMIMGATITFAHQYAKTLADSIRTRLELAEKSAALKKSADVKTHFLAAASHDLRQPVHAMGLFAESLLPHVRESGGRELVARMENSLACMRNLLDAILDVSRLDAAVIPVRRCDFRLADLLARVRGEYEPLARQKRLDFRTVGGHVTVHSDPDLLGRILRNLVSNAIKYTEHGTVLVGCRRQGARLSLEVWDTGIGIPEDRLDDIYLEFTQVHNPERNTEKGLGLGLCIVQRLAKLLDLGISVRSRVGYGSVFRIDVPRGYGPPADIANARATRATAGTPFRSRCILVIDDDAAVRAAMVALLEQWGARVVAAESDSAAVEAIRRHCHTPDLCILDYRLPGERTARDAIRTLRHTLGIDPPVVIITGDTAPERIREAHSAGHALLHKPVDPVRLRVCMEDALNAGSV